MTRTWPQFASDVALAVVVLTVAMGSSALNLGLNVTPSGLWFPDGGLNWAYGSDGGPRMLGGASFLDCGPMEWTKPAGDGCNSMTCDRCGGCIQTLVHCYDVATAEQMERAGFKRPDSALRDGGSR